MGMEYVYVMWILGRICSGYSGRICSVYGEGNDTFIIIIKLLCIQRILVGVIFIR